jgi:aspartate/methionine/tyrosine aminotransferase
MRFSQLVERIGGEGASAWLTHYEAVAARERGEDVIILSVGDPDLATPAAVIARAIEQLHAGDTHYVPAAGRLTVRQAIARAHAGRSGQQVEADNVIYLAGAQNALFVASLCLAGPGDEVVTFEPLYPTYAATIEVSGARLVRAPASRDLRPDLTSLAALVTPRTRMILWASPNNPSGVVLNERELAVIGDLARRHDLWLVADEVYAGLAAGGRVPSLAAALPERVVTLGSLSKSHAMTGWARASSSRTPSASRCACCSGCPGSCRRRRSARSHTPPKRRRASVRTAPRASGVSPKVCAASACCGRCRRKRGCSC